MNDQIGRILTRDDARREATLPLAELVGDVEPFACPKVDFDDFGANYLREARLKTALDRWATYCPPKLQATDWQHPDLQPFAAQHGAIFAWKDGPRGLLAAGPTGRGKSRAMWHLMKTLSEEPRECRFFSGASFFTAMQSQVNYGRETVLDWIRYLARVPVVFIDDLGQEAVQANRLEWAQGWFLHFLDLRVGLGLPLFVTTNLSAKEMTEDGQKIRADPMIRRLLDLCDVIKF